MKFVSTHLTKLLSQLKSFFSSFLYALSDPREKRRQKLDSYVAPKIAPNWEEHEQHKKEHEGVLKSMTSGIAEKFDKLEQPTVEVNLDTGKIILPDNLSAEDKAAVEEALQELQKSLQNFTQDQFQSLEAFLSSAESGQSVVVPFTKVNDLPDAQLQVLEEIENCKDDTDHWSDTDFIEALFGYYNQGYDFPGIEAMANKVNEKLELSPSEQKQLRDWYMLASQELVYDV